MTIKIDPASPDATAAAALGTGPIPAAAYYDPAYFALECEAVFRRVWQQVGHVCELPEPGSFIVRELEALKASILIVRGRDGEIRAFHNVCTHRGTQLVAESSGKKGGFTCRYHAWTFNDDGSLRAAPDFERFYVGKDELGLPRVALEVCAGLIFINLDPKPAQTLREYLGPFAEQLEALPVARATTFSEYVYEINANWKLTYDNFQENYHLRFIHPRSGAAATGPDNPFGYPVEYGFNGPHRTQVIWSNPAPAIKPLQGFAFGKLMMGAMQQGFVDATQNKRYFALYPNFFILGSPSQHFSHTVTPIAANRSRGVIRLYWIGEDGSASERFGREYAMASARDIHAEDRDVIEAGQRGLESGALTHIHFQQHEVLCRHLYETTNAMVEQYRAERAQKGVAA